MARRWPSQPAKAASIPLRGLPRPAISSKPDDTWQYPGHMPFELVWARSRPFGIEPAVGDNSLDELGGQEQEVLALLAAGLANKALSRALHVSGRTVQRHVHTLMRRLGAVTRFQAGVEVGQQGRQSERRQGRLTPAPGRPVSRPWADNRRGALQPKVRLTAGRLRGSMVFVCDLYLVSAFQALLNGLDDGDWSYEAYLKGQMHPWVTGDAVKILRDSGRPILILHGAKDMGFPVQLAQRLHQAIPGSRLAIISDAAHMCHFEKPDDWSQAVREFLTKN